MESSGTVYGFGINDAGYPVKKYECAGNRSKAIWHCAFYRAWENMIRRCYSVKYQSEKPTYRGCSVVIEWRSFSRFRDWMAGMDWQGKQLDKDIIVPGNKVYGPDTCGFVSRDLNMFLTDRGALRGEWPIGVSWYDRFGKFQSMCGNSLTGKREHLGYFDSPEEAHEAWRARKHQLACQYADQQTDQRIASALRARYLRSEAYHEQ